MSPLQLKRMAALRELASLGVHQSEACRLLRIFPVQAIALKRAGGFELPKRINGTAYRREIARRYEAGETPAQIAEALNSPAGSIKVILCRLGLTAAKGKHDPFRYKRGFALPAELRREYKELRKLGLTIKEAGYQLGLLERPVARVSGIPVHHHEHSAAHEAAA